MNDKMKDALRKWNLKEIVLPVSLFSEAEQRKEKKERQYSARPRKRKQLREKNNFSIITN